jgi:hypothetical protein
MTGMQSLENMQYFSQFTSAEQGAATRAFHIPTKRHGHPQAPCLYLF